MISTCDLLPALRHFFLHPSFAFTPRPAALRMLRSYPTSRNLTVASRLRKVDDRRCCLSKSVIKQDGQITHDAHGLFSSILVLKALNRSSWSSRLWLHSLDFALSHLNRTHHPFSPLDLALTKPSSDRRMPRSVL